jgi:3-hydroxyisobutyrate dehydrogenase-like beta-hydroxyacid dehydrogenase
MAQVFVRVGGCCHHPLGQRFVGEALSSVEPLGLDPQRVIAILSDSSGWPNILKVRGAMLAKTLAEKKAIKLP